MKRTITTLAVLAAAVTSAVAADLPSKTIPTPPTPVFTHVTNYYVGVNVGADTATNHIYSGGIAAGVNVLPYLAVEAAYDFGYQKDKVHNNEKLNELSLNAIPQYKVFGTDFTAYGLGGVGYKYDDVNKNIAFYNVGGGFKYDFAKNLELDARYRYSDAVDNKFKGSDQRYTLGVGYKF